MKIARFFQIEFTIMFSENVYLITESQYLTETDEKQLQSKDIVLLFYVVNYAMNSFL